MLIYIHVCVHACACVYIYIFIYLFIQEQWTEAQQERLELQRARVLEVNRHLAALISSWERGGLPLHMNLAFLSTPTSSQLQQDILSRLKQQNHRLTEVN